MLLLVKRSKVERPRPLHRKCNKLPGRAVACLPTTNLDYAHRNALKILKHIQSSPEVTQRQLAQQLGVSVGEVNYCINALVDKGLGKAGDFKRNSDKWSYLYLLTPKGIEEKSKLTARFLKRKLVEREKIILDIKQLKRDG